MGYQGVTDIEYWRPSFAPGRGSQGRPKVHVERTIENFPPPTPQPTPCRLWQGAVDGDGYGVMADHKLGRGRKKYAHRWVWEAANGPIKAGLVIRHKCDNRPCFRLSHLEIGTVADNNRDASERGHLGRERALSPNQVKAIMVRREAGETWRSIAGDYPGIALATIKRAKDYIHDVP